MMAETWSTAMITAHRPQHLDPDSLEWIADQLHRVAVRLRDEFATTTLISGLALGGDMLWANAAIRIRMPLAAHIPFRQQPDVWRDPELRRQWQRFVDYAERTGGVKVYGDCPPGPGSRVRAIRLLHARNDGMIADTVAAAGCCVAVLRSSKLTGGTRSAYDKASALVPIIRVDPDAKTVTIGQPKAVVRHEQETLL